MIPVSDQMLFASAGKPRASGDDPLTAEFKRVEEK